MTESSSDPNRSDRADAARLMVDLLACPEGERAARLERICREQPAVAPALHGLFEHWRGLASVLERLRSESLADHVERRYGQRADPHIELEPTPRLETRGAAIVEGLGRLLERGGRYRILGEIARGATSTVLRVRDRDLHRTLAMKVSISTADADAEASSPAASARIAYFLQEAQIMAQLEHPGVVPVHEVGLDDDGRVFFTMALVGGREFRDIIRLVHAGAEGWTLAGGVRVLLSVCETIAFAHQKHVVHRDLKPSNIMVGAFGEVYVMDWGLARVHGTRGADGPEAIRTDRPLRADGDGSAEHTLEGDVVGTPAFMAPEQAAGRLDEIGPQVDVYSLGATLYTLLAGRMPYTRPGEPVSARGVVEAVLRGPPEPLCEAAPAAPLELIAICEKAMARDRGARYADAEEFARDLRAHLEQRVVRAHETGLVAEARKWARRNRSVVGVMFAAAVAITAACLVSAWLYVDAQARRESRAIATAICTHVHQSAAKSHLWFEEAAAGDPTIDLPTQVFAPIDAAIGLAEAAAGHGGETQLGAIEPLPPGEGGAALRELGGQLREFRRLTEQRWVQRDGAGRTGGELDQRYDRLYGVILETCATAERQIAAAVAGAWRFSASASIVINVLAIGCFGVGALLLGRLLRR